MNKLNQVSLNPERIFWKLTKGTFDEEQWNMFSDSLFHGCEFAMVPRLPQCRQLLVFNDIKSELFKLFIMKRTRIIITLKELIKVAFVLKKDMVIQFIALLYNFMKGECWVHFGNEDMKMSLPSVTFPSLEELRSLFKASERRASFNQTRRSVAELFQEHSLCYRKKRNSVIEELKRKKSFFKAKEVLAMFFQHKNSVNKEEIRRRRATVNDEFIRRVHFKNTSRMLNTFIQEAKKKTTKIHLRRKKSLVIEAIKRRHNFWF